MKSFDKFQFDSSPLIDEEMEDLDESLVGAVRSAGQVIGNRLKDTGKALERAQKKASTLTSRAASKVQSVQKNLNKKIQNVAGRTRPDLAPDPKANTLLNKSGSFTGVKPTRPLSRKQQDDKADAISGLRTKGRLPDRFQSDTTKASKFRDLTRGGLRSSLARTAGSGLLNVYRGLAKKPDTMVSSDAPGTGSLGAFQGIGSNVQSAAKNLAGTKRFQPTTTVKTGYNPGPGGGGGGGFRSNTPTKPTPGKDDGRTLGSTLRNTALNAITNQRDTVSPKKKPVKTPEPTGSARVTRSDRTDIPQGKTLFRKREKSNQERTSAGKERTRQQLQKIANQKTPRQIKNIIKTGTKTKPDSETQKDLDNFKPSDLLNRPKDNLSSFNQYLQSLNRRNKNSSIVPKKKPVSRTDIKKDDEFTDKDLTLGKAAINFAKMAPKADADFRKQAVERGKKRQTGADLLKKAVASQADKDDNTPPTTSQINRSSARRAINQLGRELNRKNQDKNKSSGKPDPVPVGATKDRVFSKAMPRKSIDSGSTKSTPSSTQKSLPPAKKLKRPNIRSYKNDPDGYEKARAAYNAQSPELKTRKGGGRPKKQTDQEGNESEMQKYKKDLRKRGVQEQFSDWREEFLWEVDKKYPEKIKEIKPMTGKNTITVNPEDKGAKYKRGY